MLRWLSGVLFAFVDVVMAVWSVVASPWGELSLWRWGAVRGGRVVYPREILYIVYICVCVFV